MLNFYHISVIQFFKSNWPEVRAAAAMFIGTVAPPSAPGKQKILDGISCDYFFFSEYQPVAT